MREVLITPVESATVYLRERNGEITIQAGVSVWLTDKIEIETEVDGS
jgi:hypothetical protein